MTIPVAAPPRTKKGAPGNPEAPFEAWQNVELHPSPFDI